GVIGTPLACSQADEVQLKPGQWQVKVTVLSSSVMPNGEPATYEECSKTRDIRQFSATHFLEDEDENLVCKTDQIILSGQRVSGVMQCNDTYDNKHSTSFSGLVSPTHIDMVMAMSGRTPGGEMSEKVRVQAAYIGECKS